MKKHFLSIKGKNYLGASIIAMLILGIASMAMLGMVIAQLTEPPWVEAGTLDISGLATPKMYVSTGELNDWEYNASALGEQFTIQIVVDDLPESNSTTTDPYRGCFGFGFRLLYNETQLDVVGTWSVDPTGWAAGLDSTPFLAGPIYESGKTGFDWTGTSPYNSPYNETYGLWTMDPVVIAEITFEVEIDTAWPDTLECLLNLDETKIATYIGVTPGAVKHQVRDGVYRFVTAAPEAPTADFTFSPSKPRVDQTITFNASASTPDGGYITLYSWNFSDGTGLVNTTDTSITHTYSAADTYNVTLTVYDSELDMYGKNLTDTTWKLVEVVLVRPLVRVSPQMVTAAKGETFTVNVNVINVTNLYAFAFRLSYDTALLDGVTVLEGPFLKTGGTTYVAKNETNELLGYARIDVVLLGAPEGVDGDGTLATITFNVTEYGCCVLHLYHPTSDYLLGTYVGPDPVPIEHDTEDGYSGWGVVEVLGESYPIPMATNSTVSAFEFRLADKEITFDVEGPDGTTGFCKIAIPKDLLRANTTHPWTVLLNDLDITAQITITEDDTHTFIYFTYTHTLTSQGVNTIGTWVVPEFPTALILPILMIATLAAAILGKITLSKKRRRPIVTSK